LKAACFQPSRAYKVKKLGFTFCFSHSTRVALHRGGVRRKLSVAVSPDGSAWNRLQELEGSTPGLHFSYPTLQQDGCRLLVAYSVMRHGGKASTWVGTFPVLLAPQVFFWAFFGHFCISRLLPRVVLSHRHTVSTSFCSQNNNGRQPVCSQVTTLTLARERQLYTAVGGKFRSRASSSR
jgi:hypothetical protein